MVAETRRDHEEAVRAGAPRDPDVLGLEPLVGLGEQEEKLVSAGIELIGYPGTDGADILVVDGVSEECDMARGAPASAPVPMTAPVAELGGDPFYVLTRLG